MLFDHMFCLRWAHFDYYIVKWKRKKTKKRKVQVVCLGKYKQEMFVKHFCHKCFVKLDKSVQNKFHKCMKKKFILGNCYLNNLKQFWHIWPRWPKINRVTLRPRTNVWTKFEVGMSRRSRVIDWKQIWHIWPWWPWPLT